VNSEVRLANIVTALEQAGIACLVMGGHAVRFYGLLRNTVDFDLQLSPECWDDLPARLESTALGREGTTVEGPSWRGDAFRRFQIGHLPDGGEEWLEFWRTNHLLAPFAEAYARHEEGMYGGRVLPFLGLADLIRSKETERPSDWQDVRILEEFLDARFVARVGRGEMPLSSAMSQLRSQRGFESYLQKGLLGDKQAVKEALSQSHISLAQAYLLPFVPDAPLPDANVPLDPVVVNRLRRTQPASPMHLALVETVRRQYQYTRRLADKADKEAIRLAQSLER
jgi:hypothetical protein